VYFQLKFIASQGLEFYLQIEKFKREYVDEVKSKARAAQIFDIFISNKGKHQINLDHVERKDAYAQQEELHSNDQRIPKDFFNKLQQRVLANLHMDAGTYRPTYEIGERDRVEVPIGTICSEYLSFKHISHFAGRYRLFARKG